MRKKMTEVQRNHKYESDDGVTVLERDTPGSWTLYYDGYFVDRDQYRNTLAEAHCLDLHSLPAPSMAGKLTIILGKNIGKSGEVWEEARKMGYIMPYPELYSPAPGITLPGHPDDFIPDTLEHARELLAHGKDVVLYTMSEYLVSRIAESVADNVIPCQRVVVRLYEDDNSGYRDFGLDRDGVLSDAGFGSWPIGWFMPSF